MEKGKPGHEEFKPNREGKKKPRIFDGLLYDIVKGVGDSVSDVTYNLAGGREADSKERKAIAEERLKEIREKRAKMKDAVENKKQQQMKR